MKINKDNEITYLLEKFFLKSKPRNFLYYIYDDIKAIITSINI